MSTHTKKADDIAPYRAMIAARLGVSVDDRFSCNYGCKFQDRCHDMEPTGAPLACELSDAEADVSPDYTQSDYWLSAMHEDLRPRQDHWMVGHDNLDTILMAERAHSKHKVKRHDRRGAEFPFRLPGSRY